MATTISLMLAGFGVGCPSTPGSLQNGSFRAELNGFEIHYEVHGSGPVLMTVPNSWGLTLEGLRAMYRPLEEQLTLVYFDPRGMGKSAPIRQSSDMGPDSVRADFDALRRHLGLERVAAIGWSNGASNLMLLAAEHPDTIEAAIFLHGTASFLPEDAAPMAERYRELMRAFAEFQQEMASNPDLPVEEQNARTKQLMTEVWFPEICGDPGRCGETIPAAFADAGFSFAHSRYTQQVWPTFDARERLPQIRARSLVIAGSHDMLPIDKAREIVGGIADARLVVLEESGHFGPLEEPERFAAEVWSFLGRGG